MAGLFSVEFLLFLGGLALIFMAGAARGLSRWPDEKLPWVWLALFGVGHGLCDWADMLALDDEAATARQFNSDAESAAGTTITSRRMRAGLPVVVVMLLLVGSLVAIFGER